MGKTPRNSVGIGLVVGGVILAVFAGWRYESDMPGFSVVLSDPEIRADLDYIKST